MENNSIRSIFVTYGCIVGVSGRPLFTLMRDFDCGPNSSSVCLAVDGLVVVVDVDPVEVESEELELELELELERELELELELLSFPLLTVPSFDDDDEEEEDDDEEETLTLFSSTSRLGYIARYSSADEGPQASHSFSSLISAPFLR